jgi:protein involved in polysaccharide export with SLBB domain
MAYELRKNESLATLLKYSGNFANDAYKKSLRVFRKNGRMKSVYNVEEFEMPEFKMFDGDSVEVDSIIDRFENTVEVKGAIYRPGMYQLGEKVNSVRSLIESADGLTEEAMLSRAVIRLMKPNRTQEVLTVDLKGIIEGTAADVPLENEDILFIPTQAVHQNLRTLSIDGEVIFPGTYEYAEKMTVEDLILQAGGLTDNASTVKVDVARRMIDPEATTSTMEIAKTYSFSIKPGFEFDGDKSFTLQPYDAVSVRRSPVSVDPFRVRVEGEIAFEGFYTLEQKNQRLSDVVKAAGGVIPGAYVRGARLIRNMNEDELARRDELIKMARQSAAASAKDSLSLEQLATETTYLVGIHLDEALANPGCDEDVELQDGDRLVIPRYNRTVKISGDVQKSNTVAFKDKKNYKYYIDQAGGYGKRARKSHTYILYQNGTIAKASKGDIEPGCEIVVPTKGPKDPAQLTQWLGIGTSAASMATMFVSIANMLK